MRISKLLKREWDAIIVGGGHNGLVTAAYLAKAGKRVCVLEKRHVLGGCAVTEEIFPGFHFSRASYVYSLFRPQIVKDLDLQRHGLKIYSRDPSSFTPTLNGKYLLLGSDMKENQKSIAQFSSADAEAFPKFIDTLERMVQYFEPMLDEAPIDLRGLFDTNADISLQYRLGNLQAFGRLASRTAKISKDIPEFLEFMTAPATKILNRWFESDILKATLATDSIIGSTASPSTPGSSYILFHHVMGQVDGVRGTWGHVKGGMGAVSQAIARAAVEAGANLQTSANVERINICPATRRVSGVTIKDGDEVIAIEAKTVISNANPTSTMLNLIDPEYIPNKVRQHFQTGWDIESASTKINVTLNALPNFTCLPSISTDAMPHHYGTIHFEDSMRQIENAYIDSVNGNTSARPVIEMNLPTALDSSIAPLGKHIALLFVQYTPYMPKSGAWDTPGARDTLAKSVFSVIEQYAPGFTASIRDFEVLTPVDLERIFSLPKGNIFHGSMSTDQLYWHRPIKNFANYRSPIKGLYFSSAGCHPGGGVLGACGRNAAMEWLKDMK